MTNNAKSQWAAPKLQRLSAKLAENGAVSTVSDNGQNNKS
jgi:hypothetical protein